MKLNDLAPLEFVAFYNRHVPVPVSQLWYQSRYKVKDLENAVSGINNKDLVKAPVNDKPAIPLKKVFEKLTCEEKTQQATKNKHLSSNSFKYGVKMSTDGTLNFGESIQD